MTRFFGLWIQSAKNKNKSQTTEVKILVFVFSGDRIIFLLNYMTQNGEVLTFTRLKLMDQISKELHFLIGLMDLLILAQMVNISCFHQIKTRKKRRNQSFFSRMELPMKQVLIFSLLVKRFQKTSKMTLHTNKLLKS